MKIKPPVFPPDRIEQGQSPKNNDVVRFYSYRAKKIKFLLRLYAIVDILTATRFELVTYKRNGVRKTRTRFDKEEIETAGRSGLL